MLLVHKQVNLALTYSQNKTEASSLGDPFSRYQKPHNPQLQAQGPQTLGIWGRGTQLMGTQAKLAEDM